MKLFKETFFRINKTKLNKTKTTRFFKIIKQISNRSIFTVVKKDTNQKP